MEPSYDVAIIGGGPAGSTAATFLSRKGRKVVVFEREKFPRFHIGESLLPFSMDAFRRLGVVEKLDAAFLPKYGAEITSACGSSSVRIAFKDGLIPKYDRAYQVTRSEFDKILLDHSAENGATVREETSVESVEFGPDDVLLAIKSRHGSENIRASYLLDCSGRGSVVGAHFDLKRNYPNLKKFSVFAHYENVDREEGKEGTFIRIIRGKNCWFWMIPLTQTKMSIGLVTDIENFKAMKKTPEAALEDSIGEQPQIWSRMARSSRITQVYSASDYSYRNTRIVGDRWLLAGDAAGFIDPVFSTGVFLGIRSGEAAAEALDIALESPRARRAVFRKYERSIRRVMNLYLRFVNNWYKPHFAEIITHPVSWFRLTKTINSVLAGNLNDSFSIKWRMELFYFFVFLQKYIPLCPRLSLDPRECRIVPLKGAAA